MTPRAEETLVRRACWMPFEQARDLLQELVGIQVSKATARRATLQTGAAALWVGESEVERLKQEVPQAPRGADKQQLSADGAMIHLVGGEWVEVKEKLAYLQKREVHMQYPIYQAAGWPIGSGSMESAGHRWSSKHV